ncbi:hypothetical protein GCM10027347_48750 [Larkinella harenae]
MNSFATSHATLNLSHIAIREADIDLSELYGISYWFLPPRQHAKIDSCVVWLAPGASGTTLPAQLDEEAYISVEAGEADISVNGNWIRLKAGQSLTVPGGIRYSLRNSSVVACLLCYCVSTRPGF